MKKLTVVAAALLVAFSGVAGASTASAAAVTFASPCCKAVS